VPFFGGAVIDDGEPVLRTIEGTALAASSSRLGRSVAEAAIVPEERKRVRNYNIE
jgi:hypothetical protein